MRYIALLLVLFTLSSCYETERKCSDFKTGTFEFEQMVGTKLVKTTFWRTDSIEIDYFNEKVDTFAIRWINDCEYVMKKLRPVTKEDEEAVHFKVINTSDDTYTFQYSMVIKKANRKRVVKKGVVRKISDQQVPITQQ